MKKNISPVDEFPDYETWKEQDNQHQHRLDYQVMRERYPEDSASNVEEYLQDRYDEEFEELKETTGPHECYLLVTEMRSGNEHVTEIKGNMKLDLETRVKVWIKETTGGECKLDGEISRLLPGDYYAAIITDWRPKDSVIVWSGGGFYVK